MSYRIVYTKSYTKRASRFIRKHPGMLRQYEKTLKLLELNPFHPSLKLHALSGRLQGLHAISVNIAYRITLEFLFENDTIIPVDVGDHDEVYRR